MTITECDVPRTSVLDRNVVAAAYFRDAWCAPLARPEISVTDIFSAVFAHHPLWIKGVLIARNRIARGCGLDAPDAHEVFHPAIRPRYAVGDTIGVWPIFALTDNELVAGRNNKHLDFRLSVLKSQQDGPARVVLSTVCNVHNRAGRLYLFFVIPFHRWGMQRLIANAINAGRL